MKNLTASGRGAGSYSKSRGDMGEAIACAWLRGLGYEVFPNIRSTGPIDIVAIKDGKTRKIDVKLVVPAKSLNETGVDIFGRKLRENQIGLDVEILYVAHDGFCAFSRRVMVDHLKPKTRVSSVGSKRGRPPKLNI